MDAQQSVEARLADFGNRMETRLQQQQEQALKQAQEQTKAKEPEVEHEALPWVWHREVGAP